MKPIFPQLVEQSPLRLAPAEPPKPKAPGEILLSYDQAQVLARMSRPARRALLAHIQTRNPRRRKALRTRLMGLAARKVA